MVKSIEVINFWFEELKREQHFKKDVELDREIARRFSGLHELACAGELAGWRDSPPGRLAEIIVLDQFSRNLFRDDRRAWAQDSSALSLAKEMVAQTLDESIDKGRRSFVYMPYMHSEDISAQDESVRLFQKLGDESSLKFAILHRDVIAQFGRFPYRNEVLGRISTTAELDYVEKHGSF